MDKTTKAVLLTVATLGVIYLFRKNASTQQPVQGGSGASPSLNSENEVGSNATQTRGKKGDVIDITTRRCIDQATGKIIYVKGPCPEFTVTATSTEGVIAEAR